MTDSDGSTGSRVRRFAPRATLPALAPALMLCCLALANSSCTSTRESQQITMESPRTNGGLLFDEPSEIGLARIEAALDRLDRRGLPAGIPDAVGAGRIDDEGSDEAVIQLAAAIAGSSLGSGSAAMLDLPADAGMLLPLSKLSRFELGELLSS
ncbi:MAG: hypothetical protein AAGA55_09625, partial [Planctomycetota bacterium]